MNKKLLEYGKAKKLSKERLQELETITKRKDLFDWQGKLCQWISREYHQQEILVGRRQLEAMSNRTSKVKRFTREEQHGSEIAVVPVIPVSRG